MITFRFNDDNPVVTPSLHLPNTNLNRVILNQGAVFAKTKIKKQESIFKRFFSRPMKMFCQILLLLLATACANDKISSEALAIPVVIQEVKSISNYRVVSVSGSVQPYMTVNIGFMVAGKVAKVYVDEGDYVHKNDLVATLDTLDYHYNLEIATAAKTEANDQYNRLKLMYDRESLAESDFIKVSAARREANAQYELAKRQLNDSKLIAPITGILARKGVEEGEIIAKGLPLFTMVHTDTVKVNVAVPESEIAIVAVGEMADVVVPALDDSVFTGRVVLVGAVAEPASRTYTVKISLANPDLLLRAGMIAEARIQTSEKIEGIVVPGLCIVRDADNLPHIFVVDTFAHKAFKQRVVVGNLYGSEIEITDGLKDGELIVIGGQHKLHDGMAVEFAEAPE